MNKSVLIRFSSLRNGIGPNLGVVFDVDKLVTREAYKTKDGWRIKGLNKIKRYDPAAEVDQECLDNCDPDEVEIIG